MAFRALGPRALLALDDCDLRAVPVRVQVVGANCDEGSVPDVAGHCELLGDRVRFVPHFPFVPGIIYLATMKLRPAVAPDGGIQVVTEFSIPRDEAGAAPAVTSIFPSGDVPENLLRFYVYFSHPMRRGHAREAITVLGPDGLPLEDVLYRGPVELWDPEMRRLTVLLDPGRLKRGVGPNRALGPPLAPGQVYSFRIARGLTDVHGRNMQADVVKTFRTLAAVREPVIVSKWSITVPRAGGRGTLAMGFGRPLDHASVEGAITIVDMTGLPVAGEVSIPKGEQSWEFVPGTPWLAGNYSVLIASTVEDVCGNGQDGAFDRPLLAPHGPFPTVKKEPLVIRIDRV